MATKKTYGPYRGYTTGETLHPGEMLREELEAREMTQAAWRTPRSKRPGVEPGLSRSVTKSKATAERFDG